MYEQSLETPLDYCQRCHKQRIVFSRAECVLRSNHVETTGNRAVAGGAWRSGKRPSHKRIISAVTLAVWLLPLSFSAQEKWPLPPDLAHFESCGCVLQKFVKSETLNAKTGQVEKTWWWRVQPYAYYQDGRPRWEYEEHGAARWIGDRKQIGDAADLCAEWMAFAEQSAKKERTK